MIRSELILDLHDELIVDNFAGGGGASSGIEEALGRHVDHAINHDAEAIGMHRINHPQTIHHCEDVFAINPAAIAGRRRVGLGHFSPDCKHFSKAKGGKPLNKKIRGLVLVILRWAAIRTRVITMENVEEIRTWGPLLHHSKHRRGCACGKPCGRPDTLHKGRTWQAFLDALGPGIDPDHPDIPEMLEVLGDSVTKQQLVSGFGYQAEVRELRACDFGAPTIRKRLFMIARCDGRPIVWPSPTHADPSKPGRLEPWKPVADCIDWELPCPSIFLTKAQARRHGCRRPLKPNTLRRIAAGIDRYVLRSASPFIVSLTHQGGVRVESVNEPSKTLTGANRGEKALVTPFLTEHANASNQRNFPADEPSRTLCAQVKGGHFALVAPTLARTAHGETDKNGKKRGRGSNAVTEPLPTTCASNDLSLISAVIVGAGGPARSGEPRPTDKPMHTLLTRSDSNLVAVHMTKFNTGSIGSPADQPAPTIVAGTHSPDTHGGAASTLGVVAASLVKLRGDPATHPSQPVTTPGHTISAGGQHHALSACYLAQHNGGFNTNPGHDSRDPISTISNKGAQQQVVAASLAAYYGSEADGQPIQEPLRSVTTKPRFALSTAEAVAPALTEAQLEKARRVARFLRRYGVRIDGEFAMVGQYIIVDIGMRMLTPRELFRAQGFREKYVIDRAWLVHPRTGEVREVRLTKEAQIRMCGNSVSPPCYRDIVAANVPELSVWNERERKHFQASRSARGQSSLAA